MLTNRTTASLDDIIELIDWFRRWKTFNILKNAWHINCQALHRAFDALGANRPRSGRGIVL
ncbi:hypothetical protein ACFOFO_05910 [Undibacterium arcticum]|uniref:Uncharacterized protein n=1 Tax=Undibacterium arcticum TaxID=1762892 RepID=A0ABV7EZU5_9BURK